MTRMTDTCKRLKRVSKKVSAFRKKELLIPSQIILDDPKVLTRAHQGSDLREQKQIKLKLIFIVINKSTKN